MYIVDTPVTKFYWEPIFTRIVRCFTVKSFKQVDGDVYLMWMRGARIYVAATLEDDVYHVYGWYYLEQQREWEAWEIYQSYIFKDHRFQGWSQKLLHSIIVTHGLMLASGPQQTHHARGLWKKLIAKETYNIWAHDFKNLDNYAQIVYDPENDSLDCALLVYDRVTCSDRDVRLIATRKSNDCSVRGTSGDAMGLSLRN